MTAGSISQTVTRVSGNSSAPPNVVPLPKPMTITSRAAGPEQPWQICHAELRPHIQMIAGVGLAIDAQAGDFAVFNDGHTARRAVHVVGTVHAIDDALEAAVHILACVRTHRVDRQRDAEGNQGQHQGATHRVFPFPRRLPGQH